MKSNIRILVLLVDFFLLQAEDCFPSHLQTYVASLGSGVFSDQLWAEDADSCPRETLLSLWTFIKEQGTGTHRYVELHWRTG